MAQFYISIADGLGDWTKSGAGNASVVEDPEFTDGHAIFLTPHATYVPFPFPGSYIYAQATLISDLVADESDVEIVTRFKLVENGYLESYRPLGVRVGPDTYGYYVSVSPYVVSLSRTGHHLDSVTVDEFHFTDNEWIWVRLRAEGSTISAKAWRDGEAEPGAWQLEVTDTEIAAGSVALNGQLPVESLEDDPNNVDYYFDVVGIGTGGDAAPTTPPTSEEYTTALTGASFTTVKGSGSVLAAAHEPHASDTISGTLYYNGEIASGQMYAADVDTGIIEATAPTNHLGVFYLTGLVSTKLYHVWGEVPNPDPTGVPYYTTQVRILDTLS